MRATQHFHCGLLLIRTQPKEKKRNSEKHTEIFLEFLVFLEEGKLKKEKQKREKLFIRESSQQAKRRIEKSFWVFDF
jgi:hypothetical protein